MGVLQKAVKANAFLKMGIYGEAGTGKTMTSILVAMGLIDHLGDGARRSIAFFDTENGSDFHLDRLEEAGIELYVTRSRSFNDLQSFMVEAPDVADVVIIDSISHVWNDYKKAVWARVTKRDPKALGGRMPFWVWGPIKEGWQPFTDAFNTSRLHAVLAGRAQNISESTEDEDGQEVGFKILGKKMRAEGEISYEPSLLVQMDRVPFPDNKVVRVATVMKDRFDEINEREFTNPTFEAFLPHVQRLNLGGEHNPLDTERTTEVEVDENGRADWAQARQAQAIAIQELEGALMMRFPSTSAKEKVARAGIKKVLLGTYSDEEIAKKDRAEIRAAIPLAEYLADAIINEDAPSGVELLPWLETKKEEFGSGWSVEIESEVDEGAADREAAGGQPEDSSLPGEPPPTPSNASPKEQVEALAAEAEIPIDAVKEWAKDRLAAQRFHGSMWGTILDEWDRVVESAGVAA